MQFDPRISPVDEHLKSQRQTLSPIDEKPIAYTSKKTRYKIPGFDVHMRKKEKLISGIDKKRNKKTVIGVQKNVDLTLNLNSNLASVGHEVDEEISSISFGDKNLMDLVEKADSRMRKHGVVNFMSKPVDVQNVDTSSDCVVINNNSAINTTSFDENECSEGFHKLHRDSDTQEIHIENCKPETITSFCETIADDDTMLRDDTFCSDNVLNEGEIIIFVRMPIKYYYISYIYICLYVCVYVLYIYYILYIHNIMYIVLSYVEIYIYLKANST